MTEVSFLALMWPAALTALQTFSIAWPVGTAVLNMILRTRTPEQWVARCEQFPRFAAFTRLVRATGLDPIKMVESIAQLSSGGKP